MNAEIAPLCVGIMLRVITRLVLIRASVTRGGQVMDKTAPTSTSVRLVCTSVLRTRTAQITKGVTRALAIVGGNVSGLSLMGDVPSVIRHISVLVMANACEMARATVSLTTVDKTVQCVGQISAARVTEPATSMGPVTVNMAGQENHWTVVFVRRRRYAVVTVHVTTT